MSTSRENPDIQEFRLDSSASLGAMLRFIAATSLIGIVAVMAAYAYGALSGENVLWLGGFFLAGAVVFSISMWSFGRGHADLGIEGIRVKTLGASHFYRWDHISQMRAGFFKELGWTNRLWATLTVMRPQRLVEIKLSRSIRQGFVSGRYSAEGFGLPLPFAKTVHIPVADPDRFVTEADRFISGKQLSEQSAGTPTVPSL
jgi:hypothetical protein